MGAWARLVATGIKWKGSGSGYLLKAEAAGFLGGLHVGCERK